MKNHAVDTKLASYGVEVYRHLEEETGLGTSMCYILTPFPTAKMTHCFTLVTQKPG